MAVWQTAALRGLLRGIFESWLRGTVGGLARRFVSGLFGISRNFPRLGLIWPRGKVLVVDMRPIVTDIVSSAISRYGAVSARIVSVRATPEITRGYAGGRMRDGGEGVSRRVSGRVGGMMPVGETGRLSRSPTVTWDGNSDRLVADLTLDVPYSQYAVDEALWGAVVRELEEGYDFAVMRVYYRWRVSVRLVLKIPDGEEIETRYVTISRRGSRTFTSPLGRFRSGAPRDLTGFREGVRRVKVDYDVPRPGRV